MKKTLAIVLLLLTILSLTSCGSPAPTSTAPAKSSPQQPVSSAKEDSAPKSQPASKYANYPAKNIELICPSAAGTGFDALARQVAAILPKYLPNNITVYVSNLSNGGGAEGWTKAYKASADGYTLLLYGVPDSLINQVLYNREYDVMKFTPLAGLTYEPSVLLARADSEAKTFADVKAMAKNKPVVFATSGAGGSTHLEALVATTVLEIPARMVHFASVPEAITSFKRKESEFLEISLPTALQWIKDGAVKPIAIMSKERVKELPDVPTISEIEGVTKEQANLMSNTLQYRRAIWAPPAMDEELRNILIDALNKTVNDAKFQEWSKSVNRPITFVPGKDFTDLMLSLFKNHSDFMETYKKSIFK